MNQCQWLGCVYNEAGTCCYESAPLKFPTACVCYDIDIRGDMGEPGEE